MKPSTPLIAAAPTSPPESGGPHLRLHVVALAAFVALGMGALPIDAHALTLGRMQVQSALGEPLRGEIELPQIDPDEAATLRATVASPEAFRRNGLEYNALVSRVQINMRRRADGMMVLTLTGDRAVNEPFVDLVLDITWASGRLQRDYTLLFDPSNTRTPAPMLPAAPAAAATSPVPPVATPVPAPVQGSSTPVATGSTPPRAPAPMTRRTDARPAAAPVAPAGNDRVTVRRGDTATQIALANKPDAVSLEQMLLAMLRNNPQAFDRGNVNRLRAGAILNMPTAEQAQATPTPDARRIVYAQARDFNDYRQRLAATTAAAPNEQSDRVSKGSITSSVEDKKPTATATDKLSLQKGGIATPNNADKLAAELQAKENAKKIDELQRNIADLKKLLPASSPQPATAADKPKAGVASAPATPAVNVPVSSKPAAPASAPAPAAAAAPASASAPAAPPAPATAPSSAPAPRPPASAAAAPAVTASKPASAPVPPPPVAEGGFIDEMVDNPLLPALAGGLLAALGGLAYLRHRRNKRELLSSKDSQVVDSRMPADSFFGATGGQLVDTNETGVSSVAMSYSPSQFDTGGDVDPLAEADVYLAYGRDLQAEEILKEAIRIKPERAALHSKLLHIFAKRRDRKAYEATTLALQKITRSQGSDWQTACEVGRELDPENPLYQLPSESALASAPPVSLPPEQEAANNLDLPPTIIPTSVLPDPASDKPVAVEAPQAPAANKNAKDPLDFDLDFSLSQPPAATAKHDPDFDLLDEPVPDIPSASANARPAPTVNLDDLPSLDLPAAPPAESLVAQAMPTASVESVDEDLLHLDLEGDDATNSDDPLATKFALAEEFKAIGDDDGARALAQEVVETATGSLKTKAERFLAELG